MVVSVESFGLGGSAGSTPLSLRLDGESPTYVFAKPYARNLLRADRWYKLGRSVLYGSLEDEAPFETVRRLVQYEDYLLRLMRDAGLPTPTPYGVVVLTPEREYLVVCEFFDGAVELGDAQIDDAVIDDALSISHAFRHTYAAQFSRTWPRPQGSGVESGLIGRRSATRWASDRRPAPARRPSAAEVAPAEPSDDRLRETLLPAAGTRTLSHPAESTGW